jgi:hypothetical protein
MDPYELSSQQLFLPGKQRQPFEGTSQPEIERTPLQDQIQQLVAILTQLAELYQLQGRYPEAELLLLQALKISYSRNVKYWDFQEISDLQNELLAQQNELQNKKFQERSESPIRTPKSERLQEPSLKRVRGILKIQESVPTPKESSLDRVRGLLKTEGSPYFLHYKKTKAKC